jgi:TetR/AcrR family fatty acid metabolism transcriptional regulator
VALPTRGKRARHDRQPEILAAAREVLESQGVEGFSVADVAARADVSEAAVFYHFQTRRELVFRVIADWMEPVIERLEADLRHINGVRQRLVWFMARHLQETEAAPKLHQLIYRELHWDNYYTSALHRLNQRYSQIVIWIVEQGKASGEVRHSVNAQLTRDLLFGSLHHIGWRTLLNDRKLDIEQTTEQLGEQLYLSICTTPHIETTANLPALEEAIRRLEQVADRIEARS